MKSLIKIAFFVILTLVVNVVFATNGKITATPNQEQENEQQGDKKPATQKLDLSVTVDGELDEAEPITEEEEEPQTVDSTEDSSVSKYNFIFYFLYKVKYDENQEDLMF